MWIFKTYTYTLTQYRSQNAICLRLSLEFNILFVIDLLLIVSLRMKYINYKAGKRAMTGHSLLKLMAISVIKICQVGQRHSYFLQEATNGIYASTTCMLHPSSWAWSFAFGLPATGLGIQHVPCSHSLYHLVLAVSLGFQSSFNPLFNLFISHPCLWMTGTPRHKFGKESQIKPKNPIIRKWKWT